MAQRRSSASTTRAARKTPAKASTPAPSAATTMNADAGSAPAIEKAVPDDSVKANPANGHASTLQPAPTKSLAPSRVLDVFLVDSGWNNDVGNAVHENVPTVASYLKGHRFFVMSREQSLSFIKRHPGLVGADPILLVVDREAAAGKNNNGCGFRLCLGHVRNPDVAISMLKWAIQLTMSASTQEMSATIRKSGHRESFQGVVEMIGESAHLLEFAPI